MWWRALFAALGFLYYLYRCYVCGSTQVCPKSEGPPPGWSHREGAGWRCPMC